ncbi:MAG: class II aldolase/adducin family protein [Bdellovibrionales bacterium]|nr:class II aldolase/adducin family protein [Bdellovibrionales bacterium]
MTFNRQKIHQQNQTLSIRCGRLHDRNMLAAGDGNISLYQPDKRQVLISISGGTLVDLSPEQMVPIDLEGNSIKRYTIKATPSSEKWMHLMVYQQASQARCVVHAPPPHAVAFSLANPGLTELPITALSEAILSVGSIPIIPYALPGSQQLAEQIKNYLPGHRVMIMARHGALAWGETVEEAFNGMERIEHVAYTLKLAQDLGGATSLGQDELRALTALRSELGERTR